eukprot:jgi/Mesen1/10406/ME000081S09799
MDGWLLEKAITIVSGSAAVTPDLLDKEVKELLDFDKDAGGEADNVLQKAFGNIVDTWSSFIEFVMDFNPLAEGESLFTWFAGVFEFIAERWAAFELSVLTGLGTRWVLFSPLIAIPMWW